MQLQSIQNVQTRISDIIQRMDTLSGNTKKESTPSLKNQTSPEKSNSKANFSLSPGEKQYQTVSRNFDSHLEKLVRAKSKQYNVSEDLIKAVIQTESGGKNGAVSSAGAVGLMQIMPKTARELGVNPEHPEQNVDGGVRYLKQMASKFNSLDEVLAAYNAGPGAVERHGGVPPYSETQNYIKRIRKILNDQKR